MARKRIWSSASQRSRMRREAMAAGTEKPMTMRRLVVRVTTVSATLVRAAAADWSTVKGIDAGDLAVLASPGRRRGGDGRRRAWRRSPTRVSLARTAQALPCCPCLGEHVLERGGDEVAADGERRLVGTEHGEAVELAHELVCDW